MSQTNIQKDRQTNFKMSVDNNINNSTTGKTKLSNGKKYENRNTCSKIMAEHPLIYVYVYIHVCVLEVCMGPVRAYPNTLAHRALGQNQSSQLVWRVAHAQCCRHRTSLLYDGHLVSTIVR